MTEFKNSPIKPMIILPPENMSEENITALRENGICVVVSNAPEKVKFVDAMAAVSSRTQIENAAIKLSRYLVNAVAADGSSREYRISKGEILDKFITLLVNGTPLDNEGTIEERQKKAYDQERFNEIQRIAREDARAERAARKSEAQKK